MRAFRLLELDEVMYTLIQSRAELLENLDLVGFEGDRDEITGMVIVTDNADIEAVWLCESSKPYSNYSNYFPLPYYKPEYFDNTNKPVYWSESNPYYGD